MNPKVSVIVPAYNAGKHINKCLSSLLMQSFRDFEVILIDDGSADRTSEIALSIKANDSRVRYVRKDNGGVSSARNLGINLALGEYMIQIDADDYVDAGMLKDMVELAEKIKADYVIADYYEQIDGKDQYCHQSEQKTSVECAKMILTGVLHGGMWNKLIRTSLVKESGIRFPENIVMCEDVFVNTALLSNNITVGFLEHAYLHYVQHSDSCVAQRKPATFSSLLDVENHLKNILDPNQFSLELNLFRVFIKSEFLVYSRISMESLNKLYPESNSEIFAHPKLLFAEKLTLWMCSKNQLIAANFLYFLVTQKRRIIKKVRTVLMLAIK